MSQIHSDTECDMQQNIPHIHSSAKLLPLYQWPNLEKGFAISQHSQCPKFTQTLSATCNKIFSVTPDQWIHWSSNRIEIWEGFQCQFPLWMSHIHSENAWDMQQNLTLAKPGTSRAAQPRTSNIKLGFQCHKSEFDKERYATNLDIEEWGVILTCDSSRFYDNGWGAVDGGISLNWEPVWGRWDVTGRSRPSPG